MVSDCVCIGATPTRSTTGEHRAQSDGHSQCFHDRIFFEEQGQWASWRTERVPEVRFDRKAHRPGPHLFFFLSALSSYPDRGLPISTQRRLDTWISRMFAWYLYAVQMTALSQNTHARLNPQCDSGGSLRALESWLGYMNIALRTRLYLSFF